MKKNNITELVFILDRSGSMGGLESDTIGGFNGMISKQKKEEGEAYVSTILFDNESEVVHDRILLSEIPPMTEKEYYVRGCTALLDAIGDAVKHIAAIHKYARPEDVPAHTMFIITTDGLENASRKYSRKEIKKLISDKKEKDGWEFLFIGANIDVVEVAESVGISRERTANYVADEEGTAMVYGVLSEPISALRKNKAISGEWAAKLESDKARRGR